MTGSPAERYDALPTMEGISLTRGQPPDEVFEAAIPMLGLLADDRCVTPEGEDCLNYPGGWQGLRSARDLFGQMLGVPDPQSQMIVGNNSSLELLWKLWNELIFGGWGEHSPWAASDQLIRIVCPIPGYDRHFAQLAELDRRLRAIGKPGLEMLPIPMQEDGPDLPALEEAVSDPRVKAMLWVATFSNPTGTTSSVEVLEKLARVETAAPDFRLIDDDAYIAHYLSGAPDKPNSIVALCEAAGNPERAFQFGSTAKMTFAGSGVGFLASGPENTQFFAKRLGIQSIGPAKVTQYAHVRFFSDYDGLRQHMTRLGEMLAPKFAAANEVLLEELGEEGDWATWTVPRGGYFMLLKTATSGAVSRAVELAAAKGVPLTPAGSTHPHKHDPNDEYLRLAVTRLSDLEDVRRAVRIAAVSIQCAVAEKRA